MSEVVGYHPTESEESISEMQVSLLAADANEASPSSAWGEIVDDSQSPPFIESYSQFMNGLLSPLIPSEAVWRDSSDFGETRGQVRVGLPFGLSTRNRKVLWQAGPLAFDINSVSTVALYTQAGGPVAERLADDGFLAGLLFNTEMMLHLSEKAYLYIRATPYYLITENRFGLSLGGIGGGLSNAGVLSWTTYLSDWQIKLEDRAGVFSGASDVNDLLDEIEVDEIAVAGRYRLGRQDTEPGSGSAFDEEGVYLVNRARLSATNWLDRDWQFRLLAERSDSWKTTDFEKRGNVNHLGAAVFYEHPDLWYLPWAAYDWYDINDSQVIVNKATLGATLPFTQRFKAYVKGEGIWSERDDGTTRERPGWDVGLVHKIISSFSQSLFAGDTFIIDEINDAYFARYWRYTLRYKPQRGRFSAAAFVGQLERESNEWLGTTLGGKIEQRLSLRTSLSLYGALSETESGTADSSLNSWVGRLSLHHRLSTSWSSRLTWQVLERDSSNDRSDYDEQLLMLILQWNL
jgi:hypothetical protein